MSPSLVSKVRHQYRSNRWGGVVTVKIKLQEFHKLVQLLKRKLGILEDHQLQFVSQKEAMDETFCYSVDENWRKQFIGEEYIVQFYLNSEQLLNISEIISSDPQNIDLQLSINWPQRHRWSLWSIRDESKSDRNCCAGLIYNVYKYLVCDNNGGNDSAYANLISYCGEFEIFLDSPVYAIFRVI